jgi:hypothetical protein
MQSCLIKRAYTEDANSIAFCSFSNQNTPLTCLHEKRAKGDGCASPSSMRYKIIPAEAAQHFHSSCLHLASSQVTMSAPDHFAHLEPFDWMNGADDNNMLGSNASTTALVSNELDLDLNGSPPFQSLTQKSSEPWTPFTAHQELYFSGEELHIQHQSSSTYEGSLSNDGAWVQPAHSGFDNFIQDS